MPTVRIKHSPFQRLELINLCTDDSAIFFFSGKEYYFRYSSLGTVGPKCDISEELTQVLYPLFQKSFSQDALAKLNWLMSKTLSSPKDYTITNLNRQAQKLNPEGYDLMCIMGKKLTVDHLKKCYNDAYAKHTEKTEKEQYFVKTINNAFIEFHYLICHKEFSIDKYWLSAYWSFVDSAEFLYHIGMFLAEVYNQTRAVDKAFVILQKLNDFHLSQVTRIKNFLLKDSNLLQLMTILLHLAGLKAESRYIFGLLEISEKHNANDCGKYVREIINGSEKASWPRLRHPLQAENTYRLGVIGKEKYKQMQEKFSVTEKEKIASEKRLKSHKREIPPLNSYWPVLRDANEYQKRFYYLWARNFNKGICLDLKGNIGYIFIHLYSLIDTFLVTKNLKQLLKSFERIQEAYGYEKIVKRHIISWTSDAFLYSGHYDEAWKERKGLKPGIAGDKCMQFEEAITIRGKCEDTSLDGQDLINMLAGSGNNLSNFGIKHMTDIIELTTSFLTNFQRNNGKNFVDFFYHTFDSTNLTEEDFLKLKDFFPNEKQFLEDKAFYEEERAKGTTTLLYGKNAGKLMLFGDARLRHSPPYRDCISFPHIISDALTNEANRILRDCENSLRKRKDLPSVGEGWISETGLFYEISKAFLKEKVVHHGRPTWLTPQHLDIYFPEKNIAIEYQGAQHQKPVAYFGGEKAFLKQQKLDSKKMQLCHSNSCKLLYVYEGYEFKDIKKQIEKLIVNK